MDTISVYLIRKPDSRFFKAQWVAPGTTKRKTRSLRTADPKKAELERIKLEAELNDGINEPGLMRTSWPEFVALYLDEKCAEASEQGRKNATAVLRRFAELARPRLVSDVSEGMVRAFAAALRKQGKVATTIRTELSRLRAALRWAHRQKMMPAVPHFEPVKVPRGRNIRHLPARHLPALLEAMPDAHWRLFALTAWHTGMRRGELASLRWDAQAESCYLDMETRRVIFPAAATKSRRADWLPVHPDLMGHLERVEKASGPVFELGVSDLPTLSQMFGAFCRAAGLAVGLHDIRRSFGTRYAPVVPAHILQRLMRHADIRTTLEFYADVDPSLEEAILKA